MGDPSSLEIRYALMHSPGHLKAIPSANPDKHVGLVCCRITSIYSPIACVCEGLEILTLICTASQIIESLAAAYTLSAKD